MKGGHWLTTERGWCKAGSIMQVSEGVYYKTTRGDTDHPAYSARSSTSYPDQRGCVTGLGACSHLILPTHHPLGTRQQGNL